MPTTDTGAIPSGNAHSIAYRHLAGMPRRIRGLGKGVGGDCVVAGWLARDGGRACVARAKAMGIDSAQSILRSLP